MKKSVLFVCLGNICRSPACEGICRKLYGDKLIIDSAGTCREHLGQSPDSRSIRVCDKNGIDIRQQRARQISSGDWTKFDVIAALDSSVLSDLNYDKPSNATAKLVMFNHPKGVADPYYCSNAEDGFGRMFETISKAMPDFVKEHGLI